MHTDIRLLLTFVIMRIFMYTYNTIYKYVLNTNSSHLDGISSIAFRSTHTHTHTGMRAYMCIHKYNIFFEFCLHTKLKNFLKSKNKNCI